MLSAVSAYSSEKHAQYCFSVRTRGTRPFVLEVSAVVHDCSQKTVWHCETGLSDRRSVHVPYERHLHAMTQCSVLISNKQYCLRYD